MGKKGPPYDDDPGAIYVVIEWPWGAKRRERMTQSGANSIGAWVRYMLRRPDADDILVDMVYSRTTEDIVIVQLPEYTDVTPRLGAHKWIEFLKAGNAADRDRISNIFLYNYRMNGDPEKHNWTPWIPTARPPPPERFPVKYPYPPPTWTERSPVLSSLALPIPRPPVPPPLPPDSKHTLTAEQLIHDPKIKEEPGIKKEEDLKPQLSVDKQDPYEEEDAAQLLVQSYSVKKEEPTEYELPHIHVKKEDLGTSINEYQPSVDLLATMATLPSNCLSTGQKLVEVKRELVVKPEPEDIEPLLHPQPDYVPRPTLVASIRDYRAQNERTHAQPSVKRERDMPPQFPSASRDPRMRSSNKRLKLEDEDPRKHLGFG